jgi:Ca-activated chloride channel homolog
MVKDRVDAQYWTVPGRHRRNLNFRGAGVVAAAMALVVLVAGGWLAYQRFTGPGCSGRLQLTVAAAPEIAPAVQNAAATWVQDGAKVGGTCVAVTVNPVDSATVAGAIASEHKVSLTGVGQGGSATAVPDVWLADSSTWLLRLRSEAAGFTPTDGSSIAQSPVVVAMPEPVAQQIGWPDHKLTWTDLLQKMNTGGGLKTGIVDPTRDAAGLAGLLALGAAAGAGGDATSAMTGALRALSTNDSLVTSNLLENFPQSPEAAAIAGGLAAAPISEQRVITYNAQQRPVRLAALYLDPPPPPLDYPYAVLPEVDTQHQAAAEGLRARLTGTDFRDALATAGLRGSDGAVGAGFAAPIGAPPAPSGATPAKAGGSNGAAAAGLDSGAINQALGTWEAVTLPGRVLAVFDVSGSMLKKVPTARNATRAEVTQAAARRGLGLFDDRWAVGVWVFSTELQGKQDWRELVPISPLSASRSTLVSSIAKIVPKPNGGTGLYDTLLAAYRNVQDTWEGGRVNSVILFTDGKNEDQNGISQQDLIAQLNKLQDPKRPVRVVIIGIGTEVDKRELEAIAAPTGGGVFTVDDPAQMGQIFLQAISSRNGVAR